MVNFPASLDSITNPGAGTYQDDPGFELDVVIARLNDIAEQLEAKVGVGASNQSAVANTALVGNGVGQSSWGTIPGAALAAGSNFKKIAEVAGTGASGVMEISSIPSTYRSLMLAVVGRSDTAGAGGAVVNMTFETSPTAGAYNGVVILATTAVSSSENIGASAAIQVGAVPTAGSTASVYGSMTIVLHEYANGSVFKPVEAVCNSPLTLAGGSYQARLTVGTWESASAIDRIRLTVSGNWTTASRMTLFGLPA